MLRTLAVLLLLAAPLFAQTRTARVVAENAKLRDTPDFDAQSQRDVPIGSVVKVLDEKGSWYVIRLGDRVGWIYSASLLFVTQDAVDKLSTTPQTVPQVERNDIYLRGPKGGCYYVNGSGRKVYVDHSKCN